MYVLALQFIKNKIIIYFQIIFNAARVHTEKRQWTAETIKVATETGRGP